MATVTYTAASGEQVAASAYAGDVLVLFAPGTSPDAAAAVLSSAGAKVLEQLPVLGYYLAGVAPGQEGAAIAALSGNPAVALAIPNAVLGADVDAVVRADIPNGCGVTPPRVVAGGPAQPYPSFPPGPGGILIDEFDVPAAHGFGVEAAEEDQVIGAPAKGTGPIARSIGCAKFRVDTKPVARPNSVAAIGVSVVRAAGASARLSPPAPALVNISMGVSPPPPYFDIDAFCAAAPGAAPADPRCQHQSAAAWRRHMYEWWGWLAQIVGRLPLDWQQNLVLMLPMGNAHQNLTQPLDDVRALPGLNDILTEHFIFVGASMDRLPGNAAFPAQVYSGYVDHDCDRDVVNYTGIRGALWGTSLSAPRVLAIEETLLANRPGLTANGALHAIKQASGEHGCALTYLDAFWNVGGLAVFSEDVKASLGETPGCGAVYGWNTSGTIGITVSVDDKSQASGVSSFAEHDEGTFVSCPAGVTCQLISLDHHLKGTVQGTPSALTATFDDPDVHLTLTGSVKNGQVVGTLTGTHLFNMSDNHGCSTDIPIQVSLSNVRLTPE